MRALIPDLTDDVDVHDFYASDWLEPGGVRMNFVSSADGAVTLAGRSKGLQTPGDNRIFAALRDLADVIVAGAGTVREEGYASVHPGEKRRAARRKYGLREVYPTAVISRRLDLDPSADLFVNADPDARTIVITCDAGDEAVRRELERTSDVVVAGGATVDLPAARAALEERGLTRILCEGGPHLFGDMVQAGIVDELCLSISPLLAGPGPERITRGLPWARPADMRLTGLLEEDGALFTRYHLVR